MTPTARAALTCLAFLPVTSAAAQPEPAATVMPVSSDPVVLGRVFVREGGTTQLVDRFGLVVEGAGARATTRLPGTAGPSSIEWHVERAGRRAEVSWRTSEGAEGTVILKRGGLGHASLHDGRVEVHASLELDRASDFGHDKLVRHFTDGDHARGSQAAGPVAAAPLPRGPAGGTEPARGAASDARLAAHAGAAELSLELDVLRDGEIAWSPRMRVREGEAFRARGGEPLEIGDAGLHDGFEVSGTARLQGAECVMDLALQSGRQLGGEPATWVVDRHRGDVRVPLGGSTRMTVFEDLSGTRSGELQLVARCDTR